MTITINKDEESNALIKLKDQASQSKEKSQLDDKVQKAMQFEERQSSAMKTDLQNDGIRKLSKNILFIVVSVLCVIFLVVFWGSRNEESKVANTVADKENTVAMKANTFTRKPYAGNKKSKIFQIKGLYIGMDFNEAKNLLEEIEGTVLEKDRNILGISYYHAKSNGITCYALNNITVDSIIFRIDEAFNAEGRSITSFAESFMDAYGIHPMEPYNRVLPGDFKESGYVFKSPYGLKVEVSEGGYSGRVVRVSKISQKVTH